MANFFKKLKASERSERFAERLNNFQAAYKPTLSMDQSESFPSPNTSRPQSTSIPVHAQFDSSHLTIGSGVAIFHLATARVVLCYHPIHRYHFLPKGRRDANEETGAGAEREGYEESGYRSRLLPLPLLTRQPRPSQPSSSTHSTSPYITEPIWTQLMPVAETSQYILHWYIAETLPTALDAALTQRTKEQSGAYQYPVRWREGMTIRERILLDVDMDERRRDQRDGQKERYHEPVRHEGTGVDEEEKGYESFLVGWEEGVRLLGEGSVSADVVRRGWKAVELRVEMEGGGKGGGLGG